MRKPFQIIGVAIMLFLVLGVSSSVAYFTKFIIGPEMAAITLSGLQTATSSVTISFDPSFVSISSEEDTDAPYSIKRRTICNQRDENFNCLDAPPDLCPYLSIESAEGEPGDTGFTLMPSFPFDRGAGALIVGDTADAWNLTISSPCFEDECPIGYSPLLRGNPLPQNLKGQTFKCDLSIESAAPVFLAGIFGAKSASAAESSTLTVSAILTGGVPAPAITPVIIVPGIMGSELRRGDGSNIEVWLNLVSMLLPGDSYLDELKLSTNGEALNVPALVPTDIIRSIDIPLFKRDNFNSLLDVLKATGYEENRDLFVFPYDWRLDINVSSQKLEEKIKQIKLQTGSNKVDIIAHSMGGLLVKEYFREFNSRSIGKFVDIATPHFGSPSSFGTMNYGNTGISILNQDEVKSITQNMPSLYELLPSQKYFDETNPNYKYYVFNGINTNQRLSFGETKQFLKDGGRNAALLERADTFHQQIDNLNPANYGVQAYNIVGCGTPTIGQFFVLGKKGDETEYDIKMISGDGTVPLKSAEALPAVATYYAKGVLHATMPSTSGIKELVAALITDTGFDFAQYPNMSTDESSCPALNGTLVSFHSPITLNAYDSSGNHSGPDANGDIEQNIPGADYEVIENNKFVYLPAGTTYRVEGKATGAGTFDARVESIVNGEVATTSIWNNVPLTLTTQAKLEIGMTLPTTIALDANSDGSFEINKTSSSITAGFVDVISNVLEVPVLPALSPVAFSAPTVLPIGSSRPRPPASTTPASSSSQPIVAAKVNIAIKPVVPVKVVVAKPKLSTTTTATPSQKPETNYENTAVVYKSAPSTVKNLLRSMWSWFKSKL